jgi:ribose/xylose/arabinose/galactoside ABC-type transport system permease subunit
MKTATASHLSTSATLLQRLNRREVHVGILLFLTVATVSIINPRFCQVSNLRNMLVNAAPVVVLACGLTLVIVTGEIDISIGSLMGLLAAVMGATSSSVYLNWPAPATVAFILALGLGVGLVNGLLVTYGRVPSIIVTLGMMMGLWGVTKLFLSGYGDSMDVSKVSASLRWMEKGTILGVPAPICTALVVFGLTVFMVYRMPLGRRIYAVGSNARAARLAGISERGVKLFVFALMGFLTGVACLVQVPMLAKIESGIGQGRELLAVTCVVVGGTSISGGRGTIVGSVLSVLLLGSIGSVLLFLRLGENLTYWEQAIQGAFVLAAVLVDHLTSGGQEADA